MSAAKGSGPKSVSVESLENCVHEGALLLVAKSAKGLRHFNSYCRMLTFRILSSSLCKVENQENKSVMSGKLFFAVYFAVIFLKRRNYNENFMYFHLYGLYPCLNALIAGIAAK